jgi:transposase
MTNRQIYTKEFKLEAVRLLTESDKSGTELARELGVRRNQLYKWRKELEDKGEVTAFKGPGRKVSKETDKHDEVNRLQKENEQLREELEIIKKAAVDSIGQRNNHMRMLVCGGLLNEAHIYSTRKRVCF